MFTGEGAEEIAENLPSVTDQIIHEHEEMAEKLALVLYVLGGISLVGLYLNFKNHAKSSLVSYFAFVVALVAVFLENKQVQPVAKFVIQKLERMQLLVLILKIRPEKRTRIN